MPASRSRSPRRIGHISSSVLTTQSRVVPSRTRFIFFAAVTLGLRLSVCAYLDWSLQSSLQVIQQHSRPLSPRSTVNQEASAYTPLRQTIVIRRLNCHPWHENLSSAYRKSISTGRMTDRPCLSWDRLMWMQLTKATTEKHHCISCVPKAILTAR